MRKKSILLLAGLLFAGSAWAETSAGRARDGFEFLNFDANANAIIATNENGYSIAGGAYWRPRWETGFRIFDRDFSVAARLGAEFSKNALDQAILPVLVFGVEPEIHFESFSVGPDLGLAYVIQDTESALVAMFGAQFAWEPKGGVVLPFVERVYLRYDLMTSTNTGHLIALGVGLNFSKPKAGAR